MALERPATAQATRLGKYELIKELAGSGVASSWVAKTSDEGKLLSVMRVHRHVIKKTEHIEAFLDDARRAQPLRHANVLPFVDVGVTDGEVFVVLEHVEGELLSMLITQAGAAGLPQPIALRIARDAFEGLAAGHAAGVFHGEFAPHHVRVGIDGATKVAGFGVASALARMGPHGIKNHDRLAYAAPERVKSMAAPLAGSQTAADERSDVFSAGVVLWELLAKQRLFSSKIEAAVIQKVLTAPVPTLASVAGASVPESLDQALQRALTRDPAQRLGSVQELVDAIDASGADFASQEEVAQLVEKLAGKTIAARKLDLMEAAAAAKASGPSSAVKVASRKATLMGFAPPTSDPPPASTGSEGIETKQELKVAAPRAPMISTLDDEWVNTVDTGDTEVSGEQMRAAAAAVGGKPMPPPRRTAATMLGIPPLGGDAPLAQASLDLLETTIDDSKPPSALGPPTIDLGHEEEAKPATRKPPPPPPKRSGALSLGSLGVSTAPPVPKEKDKEKSESPKPSPVAAKKAAKSEAPPEAPPKETVRPARVAATEAKSATPPPASTHVDDKPSETPQTTDPGKRRGPAASALDKVQPGSTLGRYEILMPLARGGMASVWAGRMQGSRGFSKIVAIKTMLPDISDDPDFQTMFLDEARVAARIKHPNVAQILDLGEESDVLYLVMDWVEGETLGTLQRAAKPHGGIPLPIALRIASQALSGLHAAHELRDDNGTLIDLVHRDVSPGNVLVSIHGFVKIVDFGIAKSKGRLHVTRAGGLVKGKTPYLSPEQLGQLPIDRRSDIFSFGCLLYVLTTGLHPFRGENEVRTVENIALKAPTPPRELNPAIPAELDKIILRALEKDPAKRFATAAELGKAIAQVAATVEPTSDEDVAEFVKKAVGDTQAKRAQELKTAIASVEEASAKTAKEAVAEKATQAAADKGDEETSGVTADDIAPVAIEAGASDEQGAGDGKPRSEAPPAMSGGSDEDSIHIPQARANPRTKYIVGGVLGLCGLIGVIALFSRGGAEPSKTATKDTTTATAEVTAAPPPPAPATAAPVETAAATAAPTATEAASAAPAPTAEATGEPAPTATAEAKPKPARGGNRTVTTPKPAPPPAAKPKPAAPAKPTKKYNPTGI